MNKILSTEVLKHLLLTLVCTIGFACGGSDDKGGAERHPEVPLSTNLNGLVLATDKMVSCNQTPDQGLCPAENVDVHLYRIDIAGNKIGGAIGSTKTNDSNSVGQPGLYNFHVNEGGPSSDYLIEVTIGDSVMRTLATGSVSPGSEFATRVILAKSASLASTSNIGYIFDLDELSALNLEAYNLNQDVDLSGKNIEDAVVAIEATAVNFAQKVDAAADPIDIAGVWQAETITGENTCEDPVGVKTNLPNMILTDLGNNQITIDYNDGENDIVLPATVKGSLIEIDPSSIPPINEDGGTSSTLRISVAIQNQNRINGWVSWVWNSPSAICFGLDTFTLTRTP